MEATELERYENVVFECRDYRDYELIIDTPHTNEEGIINPVLGAVPMVGFSVKFNGARKFDPNMDARLNANPELKKRVIKYIVESPQFASGMLRVYDSSNEPVTMTKAQLAALQESARKNGIAEAAKK